jgi:CRISPR-associated endonuclease Cas2
MSIKLKRNSKPFKILKFALMGSGILLINTLSPLSSALLIKGLMKDYFRDKRFKREVFLQDLKRLQNRELIDYVVLPDGKVKITLTKQGRKKVLAYDLDKISLKKNSWDGIWRLVIFDIPDDQKKAREALRQKIKEMGFYSLQKSVFITPYECENEIDFVCSIFDIDRNNVLILEVNKFEGAEKLIHYFKLK